jgi:hypothetical protein
VKNDGVGVRVVQRDCMLLFVFTLYSYSVA